MWAISLALTGLSLWLLFLNLSHPNVHIFSYWAEYTVTAISGSTLGAVIASRRTDNPIGWIFCMGGGLGAGIEHFSAQYATYALRAEPGSLPGGELAAWVTSWMWTLSIGLFIFLCLLFPTGRLPGNRWRWVAWPTGCVVLLGALSIAVQPGPIDGLGQIRNPFGLENANVFEQVGNDFLVQALLGGLGLVATVSLFVRLHRSTGVERLQLKWFTYAATVAASGVVLAYTIEPMTHIYWIGLLGFVLVIAGVTGIPVAVSIAVLKYRLYEIDLVINRTLVYVALTGSVAGLYALLVGGLSALFNSRDNFAIALLATGLVAVLFQPLRNRLQRGVNKLMYGERDDPRAVLSRLGRRLEETPTPDAVLSAIVETVAEALKLPYVAITLRRGDRFETAAAHGSPTGDMTVIPLVYQRDTIGQLILAPRTPGEAFAPADRRLLEDLARHAEVAVHAVRLTGDLQGAREQLVTSREEERRRLRRDLHDGLGPTLGGLSLGLDAARSLLAPDSIAAGEILANLKAQTQEALSDVRRLVYGLRPPVLDDMGLVAAIREQACKHGLLADDPSGRSEKGLVFSVEAPEKLPPMPAAVEVACYRIAQEAMTNVARHARAHTCRVRLLVDEVRSSLVLTVTDDGVGIPEDRRAGIGMSSMRERAEELGGTLSVEQNPKGGTQVCARLPLL